MERRILIIDDDQSMLEILGAELGTRTFQVATQSSAEAALDQLANEDFDVVLSDIKMGGMSGVEFCREALRRREHTAIVLMTAFATLESAVAAIRAGVCDFIVKPFGMDALVATIERAVQHRGLREKAGRLERVPSELRPFPEMIGESPSMKRMYDVISRVADTDATVLVCGESGTGKELVARALHDRSARSRAAFVAINCAAMPEALLESELFGHVKGAFTDAHASRAGLLVKAAGGTLFLDEIGEMPMGMQSKLLRALQERTARPVGGNTEIPFDVRIVAATNRDLDDEVAQRRFREDLFFRINVVNVRVPPLRERGSDVLLLAQSFLRSLQANRVKVVGLSRAAGDRLGGYPWPGNVRELQNCIERAVTLAKADHIQIGDLPERIRTASPVPCKNLENADPTLLPMEEVERRYVSQILDALGGNKSSAARVLGMDRRTLYRKLERWTRGEPRSPRAASSA